MVQEKEIIILGCGLTGMLTALSFAIRNIKVTILEYQSISHNNFCNDIRTIALTPASSEFLKSINVWFETKKISNKMIKVYVVDNKAPEMLCFTKGSDALGYIVKNSEFKMLLLANVRKNPLIHIIDQCDYKIVESKPDYSSVYINNSKAINSSLLIVCDGYSSKVRQYYFFNKIEKTYHQVALTFNIKHIKNHESCAIEHFMPSGPFAILPLRDQKTSSIVWTISQSKTEILMNLPKKEFEYLVGKNCGNSLGSITLDSIVSSFPLRACIVSKYFYNKIVVVADSAHIIHPLAGQGLNQGIKDIATLTQLVASGGVSIEILDQYQKLRQKDNLNMYMITENLNSIFSSHSKSLWYLRRLGFKIIDNIQPIKNLLVQYAIGQR